MKEVKYKTPEGDVTIKRMKITDSFTNSFAEKVLKLENGDIIYIGYGEDYIQIKHISELCGDEGEQ